MTRSLKLIVVVLLMVLTKTTVSAQRVAVTSNVLEDVLLMPNVGVDFVVADNQSIAFDATIAPYKISSKLHNKNLTFRASYKYWFSQAFYAHYIGADVVASSTDFLISSLNLRSEYVGVGVSYGYSFVLGSRLNLVPHIGVGIAYGNSYEGYDQMLKPGEGVEAVTYPSFRPIVTRLGITLQYILR